MAQFGKKHSQISLPSYFDNVEGPTAVVDIQAFCLYSDSDGQRRAGGKRKTKWTRPFSYCDSQVSATAAAASSLHAATHFDATLRRTWIAL